MTTGFPIPEGTTFSQSNIDANTNSRSFTMSEGPLVITFRPSDPNTHCVLTMYDSGGVAQLTKKTIGYANFIVPSGGGTYYFSCTAAIDLVAATQPNNLR